MHLTKLLNSNGQASISLFQYGVDLDTPQDLKCTWHLVVTAQLHFLSCRSSVAFLVKVPRHYATT